MTHPFRDKLFVFIGTPERCTRQTARDALVTVGGIPDERIISFTNYVVAFNRSGGTRIYQKALEHERDGLLSVLTEEEFFDVLEGKAEPPEKPRRNSNVIVIPSKDPEAEARESERVMGDILNRKRMNNLARHGVPTPEGRVKADLRHLDMLARMAKFLKEQD